MSYDIYVLEENAITISGGVGLDGVTQGDGSHLPGQTITLNAPSWVPIAITDNDANFEDNDGNQVLNGPATLNGTTYASGTRVEAEYGVTVTDGTNSWTLLGFNVNNSNPSFGTVEGLAFIGGQGGFPPVGVPLTVTSSLEGPSFAAADYATPICMASGTLVETSGGPVPVEDIQTGALVQTRDHGLQPVVWRGARRVFGVASFRPVRFDAGAIGNARPLVLSQQHRVLIEGWEAELMFGHPEVLVPAVHLVNHRDICLAEDGWVTYHHLLLDVHAVMHTEGAWTESLHLGSEAAKHLTPQARQELQGLFPELALMLAVRGAELGYPVLTAREAQALAA